jgi:beta-phosphoglucomutase-like phosphatase (HAD superfamily)
MTSNSALDAAIRQARHLLLAFDGPIRNAEAGKPANSTTPTAPYIYEALAACRASGRSAVVMSPMLRTDIPAYLDAYDLFTQVTLIALWITDATTELEASPADCLLITSSAAEIRAAQAEGTPTIGYARTPVDAAPLADAGATALVYSLADLVLSLRALPINS